MSNITLVSCFSLLNSSKSVFISRVIWDTMALLCLMIGVPGHILQGIIMLNKSHRKDPMSFYFVAISLWELTYLMSILWIRFVSLSVISVDPREVFSCGIVYSTVSGPTIASNLRLACLSIDRSMIVLHPTRYHSLITYRHVFHRIFFITLLVILLMISAHFSLSYDPKSSNNFLCELRPLIRRWEANTWSLIRTILFAFVPSVITCSSSLIVLHNRFHHRSAMKRILSATARRMQTLSLLIALFSLINFIATLPVCILEMFIFNDHINRQNATCSPRRVQYRVLLNYFLSSMTLNYSGKFYARLILCTPFRHDFVRLIGCNLDDHCLLIRSSSQRRQHHPRSFHSQMKKNILGNEKTFSTLTYKSKEKRHFFLSTEPKSDL